MGARMVLTDSIRVTLTAGSQFLQDVNEWLDLLNFLDGIFTLQTFEVEKSNATQQVNVILATVGEKYQDLRSAPSGPAWDMVTFSDVESNRFYRYAASLSSAATNGTTNKPIDRHVFFVVEENGSGATGTVSVSLRISVTAKRPG